MQRSQLKNSKEKFLEYLFEYLYRVQIDNENDLTQAMNRLKLKQGDNFDDELLQVIRLKERSVTVDAIINTVWEIYHIVQ